MIKKLLTAAFIISALATYAQTGLTNLDFEYWTGSTPTGFFGINGTGISKQTTGAQSGSSYVRITVTVASGSLADGLMVIGTPPATLGAPYALRPYSINGYYRCSFAGPDTMAIGAGLSDGVAPISFFPIFQAQAAWTQFVLPFNYQNANFPDSCYLLFYANTHYINNSDNTVGSYLELDNLSLNLASGVVPYTDAHTHISLYPNPAKDVLIVRGSEFGDKTVVEIYNLLGKKIFSQQLTGKNQIPIDVSRWDAGVYTYSVKNEHGATLYSDKFVVAK